MGLKDLLKSRNQNQNLTQIVQNTDGEVTQIKYNRTWLSRVALYQGYVPNNNIDDILKTINRNNGYCPSVSNNSSDYKCPCRPMREDGECKCGLFKELPKRKIGGNTSVTSIKRNNE